MCVTFYAIITSFIRMNFRFVEIMKKLAFCLSPLYLSLLCLSMPFGALAGFIPDELCGDGIDNKQQYLGQESNCPVGWVRA